MSEARWLVLQEGARRRWGGDIRRALILAPLAERTSAVVANGWTPAVIRDGIRRARRPGLGVGRRRPPPRLASAELLPATGLDELLGAVEPMLLDVHDDPLAQRSLLGIDGSDPGLERRWRTNVAAFHWLVAPSASFAELAGLPATRTIVVSNGTDPRHVVAGPPPDRPAIGVVSGAAPGRGIETLVAAARLLRSDHPDLVLHLWLAAPNDPARAYLERLAADLAGDAWIEIGPAPYDRLGAVLGRATVLCVPHPPGAYFDAAMPVKLFDSMAAARPVVVTPRTEMAAVVRRTSSGAVAEGDRPEDLADAIAPFLDDADRAGAAGAAGRRAAERDYDWRLLGSALADAVLERLG